MYVYNLKFVFDAPKFDLRNTLVFCLQIVQQHCVAHEYFAAQSSLTSLMPAGKDDLATACRSHLSNLLTKICELLRLVQLPSKSCALALRILEEALAAARPYPSFHLQPELQHVIQALCAFLSSDTHLRFQLRACKLIEVILSELKSPKESLRNTYSALVDALLSQMSTRDAELADRLVALIRLVPTDLFIVCVREAYSAKTLLPTPNASCFQLAEHCVAAKQHMVRAPSGHFHANAFCAVMGYLLTGVMSETADWLSTIFYSAQRLDREKEQQSSLTGLPDTLRSMHWFWATWEAAWYCVLNKLKVAPWGRPQGIFMALQNALKQLLVAPDELPALSSSARAQQVQVLLLFLEQLEKVLHNAYEGCAVSVHAVTKPVRLFFRTNRGTCQDWIHRNRIAVIQVAAAAGRPAAVVRNALALLQDMESGQRYQDTDGRYHETEEVLQYLTRALCELGQSSALHVSIASRSS